MKFIIYFIFLLPSLAFFNGKYRILYPIKKLVRFTEQNSEVIENTILHLRFHPENRRYFHIRRITFEIFLLENIKNSTDIIILQIK